MVNKSGNKQLVNRGLHKKQLRASERGNRGNADNGAAVPTGAAGIAWKSAQKIVQSIFGGGTVRHRGPPKLTDAQKNESDGEEAVKSPQKERTKADLNAGRFQIVGSSLKRPLHS